MSSPPTDQLHSGVVGQRIPLWRNIHVLRAVAQIVAGLLIAGMIAFFAVNLLENADKQGVRLGFDFLSLRASIVISNTTIPYTPDNSYLYAFMVGVVNTLRITVVGIVLATAFGVLLGVARLSPNFLINRGASIYIGTMRNIPLVVFAFFFYFGLVLRMPSTREALVLPGPLILSNRGVYAVWGTPTATFPWWLLTVAIAIVVALVLRRVLLQRQLRTGQPSYANLTALLSVLLIPTVSWLLFAEPPLAKSVPELVGTNFRGGMRLTPEFFGIIMSLTLYIATYIGEIVRGGIQSIPKGQLEAARAIGLSPINVFRHVVMPQAMRVIIPPTIGQYINLTKGSSLAVVVGFADVFVVTRNIIEQSGRSAPMFLLLIAAYLAIAGVYALVGNVYNRAAQIVER